MHYLRLLLFPFSIVYGLVTWLRNLAYDRSWLASKQFDLPVLSIGNLAVGGAGKSPMAEYLIRLLLPQYKMAVLSRGYGRKTKGFRLVNEDDTAALSGDEPLQMKRKFNGLTVAVCEKRVKGIERLQQEHDLIILDDAFQHRAVKPGLSLLLFDYNSLDDKLPLPAGNLREPFSGRKRADILIITKTPYLLTDALRRTLRTRVKPQEGQHLFFSRLVYGNLTSLEDGSSLPSDSIDCHTRLFLITGIANPAPLVEELHKRSAHINHFDYPDHHPFSIKNIAKLVNAYHTEKAGSKLILTTEKDAQRLKVEPVWQLLRGLPVYYVPVKTEIHSPDTERFEALIKNYVAGTIRNN